MVVVTGPRSLGMSSARMIAGKRAGAVASTESMAGNGRRRRISMVFASIACIAAMAAASLPPPISNVIQPLSEAMTSAVVTAWPLWKRSPSRSVKRQASPSGEVLQAAAISGCGRMSLAQANRLS
jgi:hypothetical protein